MSYGHIDQYSKTKHTPHSTKILYIMSKSQKIDRCTLRPVIILFLQHQLRSTAQGSLKIIRKMK